MTDSKRYGYTVRLTTAERAELDRRAAAQGIKPNQILAQIVKQTLR